MIKREYIKPMMTVVKLQHRSQFLAGSLRGVNTTGLDDDHLNYDEGGGDQGSAW